MTLGLIADGELLKIPLAVDVFAITFRRCRGQCVACAIMSVKMKLIYHAQHSMTRPRPVVNHAEFYYFSSRPEFCCLSIYLRPVVSM